MNASMGLIVIMGNNVDHQAKSRYKMYKQYYW